MQKYTDKDYVFDGFCHRPFNPTTDGWMNELGDEESSMAVMMAREILDLHNKLRAARKTIWSLEQDLKRERAITQAFRNPA